MRIALLGDIHGNMAALQAVLKHLEAKSVDKLYHTGDVVGYCTEFTDVIETLITESIAGVVGNHELMLVDTIPYGRASRNAVTAIDWSKTKLDDETRGFLMQLPVRIVENRLAIFHATPTSIVRVVGNESRADKAFRDLKEWPDHWLAVHGHTHVQRLFRRSRGRTERLVIGANSTIELNVESRYIVCPGSVGVSRDRDERAGYAIFDTSGTLEFYRVPYNWRLTRAANRRAGLSTPLFRSRFGAIKDWIYRKSGERIDILW